MIMIGRKAFICSAYRPRKLRPRTLCVMYNVCYTIYIYIYMYYKGAGASCGCHGLGGFIWGFDYNFTNYKFKRKLGFQKNTWIALLQDMFDQFKGLSEIIVGGIIVESPYEGCLLRDPVHLPGARPVSGTGSSQRLRAICRNNI